MSRTIEDSKKYDIVIDFLSYKKEKERGLTVDVYGAKDSELLDTMEVKVEKGELLENGNLKSQNGTVISNFANYKKVKDNKENRKTEFARALRKLKNNERIAE